MAIHIGRREFIVALGSAAVAWRFTARAQQQPVPAETDPWATFESMHEWTPLSADLRRPPPQNKQLPEEGLAKARSSVWVVLATLSQLPAPIC